ncbi:phosphoinositide 3-kinase regulatory subunit 5 [Latimeria chalumnae]|uniref:phosphoinositide 3-kinase regulatory subunit 5 n=1 Tax=Latimeria chalumnae TaxID=7897 RepID=UPI00313AF683
MFYSAVLRAPYFPPGCDLLQKAFEIYRSFLPWPVPYCNICKEVLAFIKDELKVPGISFQRLVSAEQGLATRNWQSKTITVLLLNSSEVPSEFLSVAEQLSRTELSPSNCFITLIKHAYQSTFGTQYNLSDIHQALEMKSVEELNEIYSSCAEALETAVTFSDCVEAKKYLVKKLEETQVKAGLPTGADENPNSTLQTIPVPVAKCQTYSWDKDNFDILNEILQEECEILKPALTLTDEIEDYNEDDEYNEDEVEVDGCVTERDSMLSTMSAVSKGSMFSVISAVSKDSMLSTLSSPSKDSMFSVLSAASKESMKSFVSRMSDFIDSGYAEDIEEGLAESSEGSLADQRGDRSPRTGQKLTNKISRLFRSKSSMYLRRDSKYFCDYPFNLALSSYASTSHSLPLRRAESLGDQDTKYKLHLKSRRSNSLPQQMITNGRHQERHLLQNVCFRRRPFLSCDDDSKGSTLRVVVFGSDRISGKVARAYSNLRLQESTCPLITRYFKLQLFYIPVKRNSATSAPQCASSLPSTESRSKFPMQMGSVAKTADGSTNDISHYIGMLDPWYERNILSLLNLPIGVICEQSVKTESEAAEGSKERLPILADMVLYYCRFASHPVLLQLYQAELTFASGEKRTEVFVHSLELGHCAVIRAIKASGPGSKRLGIDGDREAIPLTLEIVYSKTTISGRSMWNNTEKICTSLSLSKACKKYEELGSRMECLHLTITEVIKRQNSKSKKSYNQISVSQIKVDKVQIIGTKNCTFAVCLDQDEKKILQSITRCEVSACYKPESSSLQMLRTPPPLPLQQERHSEMCSLLCLPIATFSGALP